MEKNVYCKVPSRRPRLSFFETFSDITFIFYIKTESGTRKLVMTMTILICILYTRLHKHQNVINDIKNHSIKPAVSN